jgi:hypothetical protein
MYSWVQDSDLPWFVFHTATTLPFPSQLGPIV